MMASLDDDTMAARRAIASCASLSSVMLWRTWRVASSALAVNWSARRRRRSLSVACLVGERPMPVGGLRDQVMAMATTRKRIRRARSAGLARWTGGKNQ